VRELVVISGKGGTGKTSLTASFAALAAGRVVTADCDVDAPDLHFLLKPVQRDEHDFFASQVADIDGDRCTACGSCREHCRFDAIDSCHVVDEVACEGCGMCELVCPHGAVQMRSVSSGRWFLSDTRYGPLVHARLNFGEGNSGKLVARVRDEARKAARAAAASLILVDGPPGIGCPVIASLGGATGALIVTEPSPSGLHDLRRVAAVCEHFNVPAAVCINRCDLDRELAQRISSEAEKDGLPLLGCIPYDNNITRALLDGQTAVEYGRGPASDNIKKMWPGVLKFIE